MTKLHQPNVLNRLGDTAAAVAAAATLRPDQLLVFVNAASSYTIKLPPVGEAVGRFVTVVVTALTSQAAVTLNAPDVDSDYWTDFTLDELLDRVTLYCNGFCWDTLIDTTSA